MIATYSLRIIYVKECQMMQAVVENYEKGSGEAINWGKSLFITSRNVSLGKRKVVEGWLGVQAAGSFCLYPRL